MLRARIESAGGYVTAESRSRDARGVNRGDLTLRVPAARLDTLVAQVLASFEGVMRKAAHFANGLPRHVEHGRPH
jgi:hypothetical protein